MNTSELIGPALEWAVASIEYPMDTDIVEFKLSDAYSFSTNWADGGPIIEQAGISVWETSRTVNTEPWSAITDIRTWEGDGQPERRESFGPTPLIAAMRCYVALKLGNEVDIPPEEPTS